MKSKIKNHITYTGTRIYGFAHKSVHTKHNICSCIKRPTRTKNKITRQGGKGEKGVSGSKVYKTEFITKLCKTLRIYFCVNNRNHSFVLCKYNCVWCSIKIFNKKTIVIYDSRIVPDLKILHIMTLES